MNPPHFLKSIEKMGGFMSNLFHLYLTALSHSQLSHPCTTTRYPSQFFVAKDNLRRLSRISGSIRMPTRSYLVATRQNIPSKAHLGSGPHGPSGNARAENSGDADRVPCRPH